MLLLSATTAAALACGGLFCNNDAPVDQSGEQIAFDIDEEAGTTTMHVFVDYEGPSEDFAWVVPVNGVPDLFRSHVDLFTVLRAATTPQRGIRNLDDGRCEGGNYSYDADADGDTDADADSDADSDTDTDSDPGVTVLASETIADYEIVTLAATDAEALITWLQDNEYDLPDEMTEAVAPYLAAGMNFVAIKLAKDTDTGQLPPLGMTYEGTTPVVPLQLTAVAAIPDMPITIYLAGEHRAVPTNYLHVRLNPMAFDYFAGSTNTDEVIGRAADEAGGQAFATEAAIAEPDIAWTYWEGRYDPEALLPYTHAADFVGGLASAGFTGTAQLMVVLRTYFPVPEAFPYDENAFYNNPQYYREYYDDFVFDPAEVVDALVEAEVEPRIVTQEFVDNSAYITRLRSSVSPAEMTLDPQFGFNPDLEEVGIDQNLTVLAMCGSNPDDPTRYASPQLLTWPSGQQILLPSLEKMFAEGKSYTDYIDPSDFAALYIEQMSTQGPPEILVDNSVHDPFVGSTSTTSPSTPYTFLTGKEGSAANGSVKGGGCGCTHGGGFGALGWIAGLGLLVRRRRR